MKVEEEGSGVSMKRRFTSMKELDEMVEEM